MIAYLGLFAAAFVAATLLPMQSEAVLGALAHRGGHPLLLLWAVATAGNVLGSVVNYGLGRWLAQFEGRRWFPASPGQIRRAEGWYRRWGRWSLLASWLPLVGDPLYAGRFRIPPAANPTLVQTLREFPRQALHARFLELDHPVTGQRMKWESPLPDDFVWLLTLLQQDREAFVG